MHSFSIIIPALESHYSLNLSHLKGYILFFFLKFPGTVRAEEDQVGLQAPEDPHDSSTDTCLTFPYSSNSPRPFPPSPVYPATDSPIRVSPLFIATSNSSSNNSPIHRSIGHNSPAPASSTSPVPTSSQTFTSIPPSQITNPSNNPFYTPYFSSSFPFTGPIVFPGGPPEFPYFGVPFPGTSSTFSETVFLPSCPIPSMVTPTAKPIPFFPIEPQSIAGFGPYRRRSRGSRGTHSGRGELPWAEEAEPPPPPVARLLPSPAIFGLVISHLWSLPEVLLLVKP